MSRVDTDKYGNKFWYNSDGKLHRSDGPAVECINGSKSWYENGVLHRINGPAIQLYEGTERYFLYGVLVTKQQHRQHYLIYHLSGLGATNELNPIK